jgi:hypothetical protein
MKGTIEEGGTINLKDTMVPGSIPSGAQNFDLRELKNPHVGARWHFTSFTSELINPARSRAGAYTILF